MDAHTAVRAPLDMAALYEDCLALSVVLDARGQDRGERQWNDGAVAESAKQASAALFRFVNVSSSYGDDPAAGAAIARHLRPDAAPSYRQVNEPSGQSAHAESLANPFDQSDDRGEE